MLIDDPTRGSISSRGSSVCHSSVALLLLVILCPALLPAQEEAAKENPQTHVSPFTEPFQSTGEPAFAYHIPAKKKFKKLSERWRIVNLEARKTDAMAMHEKRIEEEKAKKSDDATRLQELQVARNEAARYFQNTKLLLEVDGDRDEFIRIEVVPLRDVKTKIKDASPRGFIESRWKKPEFQVDRDTTSKADRKKKRQSHSLIFMATPENSDQRGWYRIETRLVPSKNGTSLYQLRYVHRMDASRFSKKTVRDAEALARFWLLP